MGAAKERRLKARANRQASFEARYGTGIKLPQPSNISSKATVKVTEQKVPGRPSSSITISRNRQAMLKKGTVRAKEKR